MEKDRLAIVKVQTEGNKLVNRTAVYAGQTPGNTQLSRYYVAEVGGRILEIDTPLQLETLTPDTVLNKESSPTLLLITPAHPRHDGLTRLLVRYGATNGTA